MGLFSHGSMKSPSELPRSKYISLRLVIAVTFERFSDVLVESAPRAPVVRNVSAVYVDERNHEKRRDYPDGSGAGVRSFLTNTATAMA